MTKCMFLDVAYDPTIPLFVEESADLLWVVLIALVVAIAAAVGLIIWAVKKKK